jgi:uncharacterized membrane protein YesL
MTVRGALRSALGELYRNSWRLLVLNSAVTAVICLVVLATNSLPPALLIAPLVAGPGVAALVHCCVTLIREDEFAFADAFQGLRLYWRRGLVLGGLFGAGLLLGLLAVSFYSTGSHRALPLAVFSAYVVSVFCLFLLVAWPLAVSDPDVRLTDALQSAAMLLLRSPVRLLTLGAVLLLVNALGTVTVLPLLTFTLAYSFLAAGHVVLPLSTIQEEVTT